MSLKRTSYKLKDRYHGVFDLETKGLLGATIQGEVIDPDGNRSIWDDPEAMFYHMIDTPLTKHRNHRSAIYWAHNGEGFDFPRMVEPMLEYIENYDCEASITAQGDNKFIGVRIRIPDGESRTYTVTLADSFAVVPASLDKMSAALAPEFHKLGHCPEHDFTQNEHRKPEHQVFYDSACQTCREYLDGDCNALWASMHNLEKLLHRVFKVPLGMTAGSIGLKALRASMPKEQTHFQLPGDKERWLTEQGITAKHGGFVWPGRQRGPRGEAVTYDRSGAYAYQMRQGVPCGRAVWTRNYRNDLPGIWDVTVHAPSDIDIPIICNSAKDQPLYPVGCSFPARISNDEISYAEKLGYSFDINYGITWPKIEYPFDNFLKMTERLEYPKTGEADPAMKLMAKLMRNAVPGKFGARAEITKMYLGSTAGEGGVFLLDPETGDMLPIWTRAERVDDTSSVLPHWNISIVAHQRIDNHQIHTLAGEDAIYGDTDSNTMRPEAAIRLVEQGALTIGNGYGFYHKEHDWIDFIASGPKSYCGPEMLKDGSIVWASAAKGIPRKVRYANGYEQLMAATGRASQPADYESPYNLRTRLLDPGKPHGIVRSRGFSTLANSASWRVDSGDMIRPRSIGDRP